MKKLLFLLLTAILSILSCAKDDDLSNTHGTKLVSIENIENEESWTDSYHYNSDNSLSKIEQVFPYNSKYRYEFKYLDGKMIDYSIFRNEDGEPTKRDSFSYNSSGQLNKIYAVFTAPHLPYLDRELEYDDSGKPIKYILHILPEVNRIHNFYWEGDNIGKIEEYDENGNLRIVFVHTYDNHINYLKNNPRHISFQYWNKNNLASTDWIDYTGLHDTACKPCTASYKYNLDGYPVEINTNWHMKMKLEYE